MILAQVSPVGVFAQLYVLAAQLLFWASVALFAVAVSPLGKHLLLRIGALLLLTAALVTGGVAVWSGATADLFLSGEDRRWLSALVITIGLLLLAWLISRRVAKPERQRSANGLRVAIVLAAAFAIVLVTWRRARCASTGRCTTRTSRSWRGRPTGSAKRSRSAEARAHAALDICARRWPLALHDLSDPLPY